MNTNRLNMASSQSEMIKFQLIFLSSSLHRFGIEKEEEEGNEGLTGVGEDAPASPSPTPPGGRSAVEEGTT